MIPKPLSDIEWSDVLALRDRGREEDDAIEYKGQFSGGPDFLTLNYQQKKNAVDVIAREVVAFLNARGGDVIIGVKEISNENPAIGAITPIPNVLEAADRLDSALSALIEPKQAIIGVRAIREAADDNAGIIIIRAPTSLRAPHWNSRNRDCLIRRGSKSVPMQMDEVQDVTLNRAARRSEQLELLERQFDGMLEGRIGRRMIPRNRFAVRLAFVPYDPIETELTEDRLAAMACTDFSMFHEGTRQQDYSAAFFHISDFWRPILRGQELTSRADASTSVPDGQEFHTCRKSIRSDGVAMTDWAIGIGGTTAQERRLNSYHDHFKGFLANSLHSLVHVFEHSPQHAFGVLRIAFWSDGNFNYRVGHSHSDNHFPSGLIQLPDFSVNSNFSLDRIFQQAQRDALALVGLNPFEVCSLHAKS